MYWKHTLEKIAIYSIVKYISMQLRNWSLETLERCELKLDKKS